MKRTFCVGWRGFTLITSGFTLIELLVVISIIAVLAAIIFPVFARVRENGRATVCLNNIRQLGQAIEMYNQDSEGVYPMNRSPDSTHPPTACQTSGGSGYVESGLWGSSMDWRRSILPYVRNHQVYLCPSNEYSWVKNGYSAVTGVPGDETNSYYPKSEHLPTSYAMNGSFFHEAVPACWYGESLVRPRRSSEIERPAQLILLMESRLSFPDLGTWSWHTPPTDGSNAGAITIHNGAITFLFADLHVKRMKLRNTCTEKLWTDRYPAKLDGCASLDSIPTEYR